ncbi:MAG: c-type cytochrome [Flavobacteriales bacterium]|nr:c-type cytochrome [Flavobacteriales bacterium]
MKKFVIFPMLATVLFACDTESTVSTLDQDIAGLNGKVLMENNCFSCHNTQGTDNMLAPPMQRVKDHYWDEDASKEDFVQAIVEWCENPTEEHSLMPGARRKFGIMPKQAFEKKEVQAIAAYLYDNDLDQSCGGGCGNGCSHDH